ncbi:TorD/DmsD family molecular chaperone [Dissulfuribacter thermophilus]|nr:molecular chaperone TorD family protein [Dissulfuribacter thermophilus]
MNSDEKNAWADFFEFVATLYLNEPDEERIAGCKEVGHKFKKIFPGELFAKMLTLVERDSSEDITQEFYDLFFVPISGKYLPPFELAQRQIPMRTDLCASVKNFYISAGFNPELLDIPSYIKMINRPDYIGFEMAFLGLILRSSAELDLNGDEEQASALLQTACSFYSQHLGMWVSNFGKQLTERAECYMYKALGHLTIYVGHSMSEILSKDSVKSIC